MVIRDRVIQNLKHGDTKEVVRFAILPKRIGNSTVWLQNYRTLYAWIEAVYTLNIEGKEVSFRPGKWVIVSQIITGRAK